MAYDPCNLSALIYANDFTLWHYRTADSIDVVKEPNYFRLTARMFRRGDFVVTNASETSLLLVVTSAEDDEVSVSPLS